jgi:c-di-GMP phosphodiesterase
MENRAPSPACSLAGRESVDGVRYVVRQPILDLKSKVHAYELLFSNGPETVIHGDGEDAVRTMIDNTVIFGFGKLTCGLPAFVKCTEEALAGTLVEMLPSGMTVLEILEGAEPSPSLIAACRNLKSAGYRLALKRSAWKAGIEPLVDAASYIKVDFSITSPFDRRKLLSRLNGVSLALIAEKVETQEQFRQARDEGFALVQGYYFCRPVMLENRKVPANRLSQVEILRMLQDESIDLHKLAQLVKRDASLTYRLLRLINSPVCAMQQEVHSVQGALLAVGEETFRRIAAVAIASDLNAGQPAEILRMAFVRGRFCELVAQFCGLDCTEQYLLGLMSLLPAMLRVSMGELAPMLPLREQIRRALLGDQVEERCLLEWLERYELGDWEACDSVARSLDVAKDGLLRFYQEAAAWAESALYFA